MTNIVTHEDTTSISTAFYKSGMFTDIKSEAQAIVKIQAGKELGVPPFAAMQGIEVIQGKLRMSSNLQASLIKRTGKYNYRVREHTDKICKIEFFEEKESVGVSEYTTKEAELAGLLARDNWKKHPRNMLFARALSNGAKWFCADVFGGPVYNESDELESAPRIDVDTSGLAKLNNNIGRQDGSLSSENRDIDIAQSLVPDPLTGEVKAEAEVLNLCSEEEMQNILNTISNCETKEQLKDIPKIYQDAYAYSDEQKCTIKKAIKDHQGKINS